MMFSPAKTSTNNDKIINKLSPSSYIIIMRWLLLEEKFGFNLHAEVCPSCAYRVK